jgi:nucleoside-diphosphate-sugar epimerase
VTDLDSLTQCCRRAQPETIFHLAGDTSGRRFHGDWHDIERALQVNFQGTLNMVRAAVLSAAPVRNFIRTGGLEEYGAGSTPFTEDQRERPRSPYSASQVAVTHFCQMLQPQLPFDVVTLRPALVCGPAQSTDFLIPGLIDALLRGKRFATTNGEQMRDLLYVDDVVAALRAAGQAHDLKGAIINICSGREHRIRDVVAWIATALDATSLVDFGAAPERDGDLVHLRGDTAQAQRLLGWRAVVSVHDGLSRTIEWYRSQSGMQGQDH